MTVKVFLLVSAVLLLVSTAVATPTHPNINLNIVFSLAGEFNQSLTKEFFVEDVSHLAEGRNKCGDKFFCKVYDILHKHYSQRKEEKALVKNLKKYIEGRNVNCTVVLKDTTPTGISKPMPDLVEYLTQCIQYRNFNGTHSNPRGSPRPVTNSQQITDLP